MRSRPETERAELWLRTRLTAAARWNLVTRRQLMKIGHTPAEVETLLRQGRLEPVERGIYALSGFQQDWRSRLYIHTIKTGGRASHLSAGLLWSLNDPKHLRLGYAEVKVVAHSRPRPRPRLKVYGCSAEATRSSSILVAPDAERRALLGKPSGGLRATPEFPFTLNHPPGTRYGIPCTSVIETLLDIGLTHGDEMFKHCFGEAVRRRLATPDQLQVAVHSHAPAGTRGRRGLLQALENIDQHNAALSGWSYLAADRIESAGLPRPILEYELFAKDGRRIGQVDLWWPQFNLVVELDGATHACAGAFQTDRRRDAILAAEGIAVVRFTWKQFHEGDYFIDIIKRAMSNV